MLDYSGKKKVSNTSSGDGGSGKNSVRRNVGTLNNNNTQPQVKNAIPPTSNVGSKNSSRRSSLANDASYDPNRIEDDEATVGRIQSNEERYGGDNYDVCLHLICYFLILFCG